MNKVLDIFTKIIIVFLVLCLLLLIVAYISQEKLIFFPEKLCKDHKFSFNSKFEEKSFTMEDGVKLHGVLFKADSSKGVIYYLHGNAGSVNSWGRMSDVYTQHNYDLFILDYRGFGKSEGKIVSEKQMFTDVQKVYDELKMQYGEEKIVLLGYSIGTGMASMLASKNKPEKLILLAPYYNLPDLVRQIYPVVPRFIIKYKFLSNEYLANTKVPVYLFHGIKDELIPYQDAERLHQLCKPTDKLYLLENQVHNGIDENPVFQEKLDAILK